MPSLYIIPQYLTGYRKIIMNMIFAQKKRYYDNQIPINDIIKRTFNS